ncbi:hypothetical protein BT96DRAFT_933089 [Gymnopus androsaceus JB14]|uniref:Uncharacterized protein n=1 Tax=Gymnopus androsaceus JB14 TaxID=1447944 RepID=A0A6A4I6N2_9AGAR|nr:hypothetical protein BT96DRAFT_933089 [Gymnopus androsaceus JB14]
MPPKLTSEAVASVNDMAKEAIAESISHRPSAANFFHNMTPETIATSLKKKKKNKQSNDDTENEASKRTKYDISSDEDGDNDNNDDDEDSESVEITYYCHVLKDASVAPGKGKAKDFLVHANYTRLVTPTFQHTDKPWVGSEVIVVSGSLSGTSTTVQDVAIDAQRHLRLTVQAISTGRIVELGYINMQERCQISQQEFNIKFPWWDVQVRIVVRTFADHFGIVKNVWHDFRGFLLLLIYVPNQFCSIEVYKHSSTGSFLRFLQCKQDHCPGLALKSILFEANSKINQEFSGRVDYQDVRYASDSERDAFFGEYNPWDPSSKTPITSTLTEDKSASNPLELPLVQPPKHWILHPKLLGIPVLVDIRGGDYDTSGKKSGILLRPPKVST